EVADLALEQAVEPDVGQARAEVVEEGHQAPLPKTPPSWSGMPARPPSAEVTPSIVPLSGGVGSPKSGRPSASSAPSAPVTESRNVPASSRSPSSRLGPGGGGGGGLSRSAIRYSISSGRAALCSNRSVSMTSYCTSVAVTMSATKVTGSPARN